MGGGKGSNKTKSSFKLPPEFIKAYNESLGLARQAIQQPYTPYTGQLVAGLTPGQQQGISNIQASQGMALPFIQEGAGLTREAARGITPELYERFYSPYVRDVANTTQANLLESAAQQRSGLKGGAIQAGAFGGDRAGIAQAEMARQQQLGNAQAMSNIYNQGYGQAMGLAGQQVANLGAMGGQLAGMGTTAQTSALQGAQAQLAAGAQEQATAQAQLQAAYDQFLQQQSYPFQIAQYFANIAQGLGSTAGGTSSTTAPPPSAASQIIGGIGALGSLASGAGAMGFSDGGVVAPSEYRTGLAGGGVPFMPYMGGSGFVPEGKLGGGGSSIPSAPNADEDKGLSEDWKDIKPFTDEQKSGLEQFGGKIKAIFGTPDMAASGFTGAPSLYEMGNPQLDVGPMPTDFKYRFARGGVAGRNGYQFGGEPTMEEAMAEEEAMREPQGVAGGDYSRLLQKESGNNFAARNKQGYVGRAQFGDARLEDARRAGVMPEGLTKEGFRLSPNTQKAVEDWHFSDINQFIDQRGLGSFEGKSIAGVPVTRDGLVNVAHLGGKGGLEKFITSGGQYNPADANGTRLSDYLAMGSSSGGVGAAPAPSGYSDTQIVPVSAEEAPDGIAGAEKGRTPFSLKNLIASEKNPSIIESIMGRRMSPEARAAVLNASFALMAGRSPSLMTNIGEAGRVGTQSYYNAVQQKQAREQQAAELAQQQYGDETSRMVAETAREKIIREQQEQAARDQMLEDAIAQLPPDQQAAARLAPDKFFGAQAESIFGSSDLPALIEEYKVAKEEGFPGTLEDWKKVGGNNGRSYAPIPYTRPDGTIGYGIPRDDGKFTDIQSPEGAEFMSPFERARQTSSGTAEGRITTEQALSAASDIQAADQALNVLDQIVTHPYLEQGTGFSSYGNFIRGTGRYDFQNLVDQSKNGAFLTAIQQLRGLGALSNTEGQAATSAITRMDTATSKEAFLQAVADYRSIIENGRAKAEARVRSSTAEPAPQDAGPVYNFNPETGELE